MNLYNFTKLSGTKTSNMIDRTQLDAIITYNARPARTKTPPITYETCRKGCVSDEYCS